MVPVAFRWHLVSVMSKQWSMHAPRYLVHDWNPVPDAEDTRCLTSVPQELADNNWSYIFVTLGKKHNDSLNKEACVQSLQNSGQL